MQPYFFLAENWGARGKGGYGENGGEGEKVGVAGVVEGRERRGTYGNADLGGVAPSQRGGHVRRTQRCPVSG